MYASAASVPAQRPVSVPGLRKMKQEGQVITALTAFELDHGGAGVDQHALGIDQRPFRRGIAEERQIGHQQGATETATHRGAVIDDVVNLCRQGGGMTLDDHAQRVADQQRVNAGLLHDRGGHVVVGRQHGDMFAG